MSVTKNFIFTLILSSSSLTLANNIYSPDYYENEGPLWFKISGFYLNTNATQKDLPAPTNVNAEKPGKFAESGYGVKASVNYFLTDYIAADLSIGVGSIRIKNSQLEKARSAYGSGNQDFGTNSNILHIPAAATLQYHIAPFGGIRPYVGAGYHASYMYSNSKALKVNNGHGAVVEAGIDFVSQDDKIFTFGITHYFLESKVKYKKEFLNTTSDVGSKVKWNPTIVTFGMGFKF